MSLADAARFPAELWRLWRARRENPLVAYGAPWRRGPGVLAALAGIALGVAIAHGWIHVRVASASDRIGFVALLWVGVAALSPFVLRLCCWDLTGRERIAEWHLSMLTRRELLFGCVYWGVAAMAALHAICFASLCYAMLRWRGFDWDEDEVGLFISASGLAAISLPIAVRQHVLAGGRTLRALLPTWGATSIAAVQLFMLVAAIALAGVSIGVAIEGILRDPENGSWWYSTVSWRRLDAVLVTCFAAAAVLVPWLRARGLLRNLGAALVAGVLPEEPVRAYSMQRETVVDRLRRETGGFASLDPLRAALRGTGSLVALWSVGLFAIAIGWSLAYQRERFPGRMMIALFLAYPGWACALGWIVRSVSGGRATFVSGRMLRSVSVHLRVALPIVWVGVFAVAVGLARIGTPTFDVRILLTALITGGCGIVSILTGGPAFVLGLRGSRWASCTVALSALALGLSLVPGALEHPFEQSILIPVMALHLALAGSLFPIIQRWHESAARDVPVGLLALPENEDPRAPIIPDEKG